MNKGRVYLWIPDSQDPLGGRVQKAVISLPDLARDPEGRVCLTGRLVRVRNGGSVNVPDSRSGMARAVAIGDAEADQNGDFLFEPRAVVVDAWIK